MTHASWIRRAASNARQFFCLPQRELVLLPLVSMLTVVVLVVTAEAGCRLGWQAYGGWECLTPDARLGSRWLPNCTAHVKNPESAPAVYRFNECGFRSTRSCGPKGPGEVRLVAIGSSNVFGHWLDIEQTFPEQLGARLNRDCGGRIAVQNLGLPGMPPPVMVKRVDDAIAVQADLVLIGLSASDTFEEARFQWRDARRGLIPELLTTLRGWGRESRLVAVARHYLYENRARYIQAMLFRGDGRTMTRPLSQDYESSFQRTADAIVSMAARLRRAGIPLVLVYIPDRLRSMLYKPHDDFPGLEPDSLRDRLAALAAHAGLTFVDPTPNFRQDPDAPSLFYPADGHMTAGGQALVATATYQALRADRRLESLVECSGFTAASAVR